MVRSAVEPIIPSKSEINIFALASFACCIIASEAAEAPMPAAIAQLHIGESTPINAFI